jgi:iron only hydrogenase large subunit-like protein
MNQESGISSILQPLTTRELVRIFKVLNINVLGLSNTDYDLPVSYMKDADSDVLEQNVNGAKLTLARAIYTFQRAGEQSIFPVLETLGHKILSWKVSLNDEDKVDFLLVYGMSAAKVAIDALLAGDLKADYMKIMACPEGCRQGGGQILKTITSPCLENTSQNIPIVLANLPMEREVIMAYNALKMATN